MGEAATSMEMRECMVLVTDVRIDGQVSLFSCIELVSIVDDLVYGLVAIVQDIMLLFGRRL